MQVVQFDAWKIIERGNLKIGESIPSINETVLISFSQEITVRVEKAYKSFEIEVLLLPSVARDSMWNSNPNLFWGGGGKGGELVKYLLLFNKLRSTKKFNLLLYHRYTLVTSHCWSSDSPLQSDFIRKPCRAEFVRISFLCVIALILWWRTHVLKYCLWTHSKKIPFR